MIAAIDCGEIQGVLCWKADRLARNPLEGAILLIFCKTAN
jgi:DNA invertase Pin-like site-specific DNA recombinase